MARLIYAMNTTLDGYVEDAQGRFDWGVPNVDVNAFINELFAPVGTLLYGRRMYDSMVYWESEYAAHDLPSYLLEWARMWQASDKIVYSRTLAEPRSTRTRIEREFDAAGVRRIKAEARRDLTVNGPELAALALRAGLVDDLHMFVWPVIVGGGKPYFPDGLRVDLELAGERRFPNGVLALHYRLRG